MEGFVDFKEVFVVRKLYFCYTLHHKFDSFYYVNWAQFYSWMLIFKYTKYLISKSLANHRYMVKI